MKQQNRTVRWKGQQQKWYLDGTGLASGAEASLENLINGIYATVIHTPVFIHLLVPTLTRRSLPNYRTSLKVQRSSATFDENALRGF